jgi:hypothetical protein
VPFERVKRSNAEIPSGSIVDLAFQTATHVMFYRPMVASQDTAEPFGEDGMAGTGIEPSTRLHTLRGNL